MQLRQPNSKFQTFNASSHSNPKYPNKFKPKNTKTPTKSKTQQKTMANYKEEELFKKGTMVEVSSEEEGLRGSWFTATVLRSVSKKTHKLLVEYHTLMADEKGSKPLREFVDSVLVRPAPPREVRSRRFRLMEDVDAFHNDGWWEGVITGVLDGFRYAVFFRSSREQIEFAESELRVHREWVRGDCWVPPLEHSLPYTSIQEIKSTRGKVRRRNSSSSAGKGVKVQRRSSSSSPPGKDVKAQRRHSNSSPGGRKSKR